MLDNIRLQIMNEVDILYNIELRQTTADELERERESAAMLGINSTLENELRTMACMTQCSIIASLPADRSRVVVQMEEPMFSEFSINCCSPVSVLLMLRCLIIPFDATKTECVHNVPKFSRLCVIEI
jgi:hypothetical protein